MRRDGAAARAGDTRGFFEVNRAFHRLLVRASGNAKLEAVHAQLIAQMGRLMSGRRSCAAASSSRRPSSARCSAAIDAGDAALSAGLLEEHIEVPQRVLDSPAARALFEEDDDQPRTGVAGRWLRAPRPPTEFGVNLNNREPLIAPDYDLAALLDLSARVEELGFDSVWVGDSLFSSRATRRWRCCRRSRSAPSASASARPAW